MVVGAGLVNKAVLRASKALGLKTLLESGFIVADGVVEVLTGGALRTRQSSCEDLRLDETAGGVDATIQIEGSDVGAPGVLLRGMPEAKPAAEIKPCADQTEVPAANDSSAKAGQLTLTAGRVASAKRLGGEQTEYGVANKLKLFVVMGGVGGVELARLWSGVVDERAMGEGKLQELWAFETVAKQIFELG